MAEKTDQNKKTDQNVKELKIPKKRVLWMIRLFEGPKYEMYVEESEDAALKKTDTGGFYIIEKQDANTIYEYFIPPHTIESVIREEREYAVKAEQKEAMEISVTQLLVQLITKIQPSKIVWTIYLTGREKIEVTESETEKVVLHPDWSVEIWTYERSIPRRAITRIYPQQRIAYIVKETRLPIY